MWPSTATTDSYDAYNDYDTNWIVDIGDTNHLTPTLSSITDAKEYTGQDQVLIGNGKGMAKKLCHDMVPFDSWGSSSFKALLVRYTSSLHMLSGDAENAFTHVRIRTITTQTGTVLEANGVEIIDGAPHESASEIAVEQAVPLVVETIIVTNGALNESASETAVEQE
ncbi:hypothetical protein IFM89_034524, partial [Coptis chinensis]